MKSFSSFFIFLLTLVFQQPLLAQQTLALGEVTQEQIIKAEPIYEIYIKRYKPDSLIVQQIKSHELESDLSVVVVFGAWCIDSKKHLPHFLKTAQELGDIEIKFYSISRSNSDPTHSFERYNVDKTPTIIFFLDGKEIGRINESPKTSIEADILSFLEGN